MRDPFVICIVGPTATGKSALALDLAEHFHSEIVSADSVQVYRGMDIGSAKPSKAEQARVPHHMIDCVDIGDADFSVARFRQMAFPVLDRLLSVGKLPVVAGGSGLYISSIVDPLGFAVPSDKNVRERIRMEYENDPAACYARFRETDPELAIRIHENDAKRIVRALEVYDISGKPLSSFGNDFRNASENEPPYPSVQIGLKTSREDLYRRIELRVDKMIGEGLIDEARAIYGLFPDRSLPAMQALGYKQLFRYFDGSISLPDAVEQIKTETRHFAKRQLTWFNRDKRIVWFDLHDPDLLEKAVQTVESRMEDL